MRPPVNASLPVCKSCGKSTRTKNRPTYCKPCGDSLAKFSAKFGTGTTERAALIANRFALLAFAAPNADPADLRRIAEHGGSNRTFDAILSALAVASVTR